MAKPEFDAVLMHTWKDADSGEIRRAYFRLGGAFANEDGTYGIPLEGMKILLLKPGEKPSGDEPQE